MKLPIWSPRDPSEADMRCAYVPQTKWAADLNRIDPSLPYRAAIETYLADLRTNLEQGKGLILYGPYRSGKSCLAALVIREVARHRCEPYWIDAQDLTDAWAKKLDRFIRIRSTPLLVLDDMGMEVEGVNREFPRNVVREVFRHRLERMRSLIVTTNLTPKEISEIYGDKLMALISDLMTPVCVAGLKWSGGQANV